MNHSFAKQMAIFVAISVTLLGTESVQAQRRYGKSPPRYRPIQYEQPIPTVDLPSPMVEGEAFPAMDDVVPPSLDGINPPLYNEELPVEPQVNNFSSPIEQQPIEAPIDDFQPIDQTYQDYSQPEYSSYAEDPAPLFSTGSWFRNGSWYTRMEVLGWTRSDSRDGSLTGSAGAPANTTLNFILNDGGVSYLFTDLVGHNFRPGARLTLGRFLGRDAAGRDHMWEIGWLGGFDWKDSRTIISRPGMSINTQITNQNDLFTRPFNLADEQTLTYAADMNSFEMNYLIRTRPGRDLVAMQPNGDWVRHGVGSQMRSVIAGMRFLSFNEMVNYASRSSGFSTEIDRVTGDTGTTISNETQTDEIDDFISGNYRVNTNNDMLGIQLGGELESKFDAWTMGLRGKVGGLYNFADRRSVLDSLLRVRTFSGSTTEPTLDGDGNFVFIDPATGQVAVDDPTTTDIDESQQGDQAFDTLLTFNQAASTNTAAEKVEDENLVFLAEVGIFGTYQLRPNLYFRAGYDMMLLSGVGLAPENIHLNSGFGPFNISGSVLFHGGSVGFEGTW